MAVEASVQNLAFLSTLLLEPVNECGKSMDSLFQQLLIPLSLFKNPKYLEKTHFHRIPIFLTWSVAFATVKHSGWDFDRWAVTCHFHYVQLAHFK